MLNPTEKERLRVRENLDGKTRANLDYRVAQKIKKSLSDIEEVNEALDKIPEKTIMRILNDVMIADLIGLTLRLLRIMRFAPVGLDPMGMGYVVRFGPGKSSKNGIVEFVARRETATKSDAARHFLIENYINALETFIDLNRVSPLSSSDTQLRPLDVYGTGGIAANDGCNEYAELAIRACMDPQAPYKKPWGFK